MADARFWMEQQGMPKALAREARRTANDLAEKAAYNLRLSGTYSYAGQTYAADDHEGVYNDVWSGECRRLFNEWKAGQ